MKGKIKSLLSISPLNLYEYTRDVKIKKAQIRKREKLIASYLKTNKIKKLQIGCGNNVLDEWLNTDLNDKEDEVAYLDAGVTFPFKSDCFDFIYSEHLFEHLNVDQQINMLEESFRILKTNAIMRIATPSLDFLNDLYNYPKKKINQDYIDWAVRTSPYLLSLKKTIKDDSMFYCYVINNFYKAWGHKMIHNFKSLNALALQAGFSEVRKAEVGKSRFESLINIERHGTIITEKFNKLETMVIELKK